MIAKQKTQPTALNKVSTLFLRAAVIAFGGVAVLFGGLILSEIYRNFGDAFPSIAFLTYPIMLLLGSALVPFFGALYQAMKLLRYIDTNQAFSMLAVDALRKIKYCGFMVGGIFILLLPFAFVVAELDDAPGLIIITTAIAGAPLAIAVFVALLEKLLESAIAIKNENDLTV